MVMLPLASLIGDGPAQKFLATVEGLVVVPLVAATLAYGLSLEGLSQEGLSFEVGMTVAMVAGVPLTGIHARCASPGKAPEVSPQNRVNRVNLT